MFFNSTCFFQLALTKWNFLFVFGQLIGKQDFFTICQEDGFNEWICLIILNIFI